MAAKPAEHTLPKGNQGEVERIRGSKADPSRSRKFMVFMHSNPTRAVIRRTALAMALILCFVGGGTHAQRAATEGAAVAGNPFEQLAGKWSGSGTIDLSNGRHEPIKCRASYDVLEEQNKLQLNIRCASESYNFDLRGSASYSGEAITGNWSESTRNAAGTLSGSVKGSGFRVVAKGPSFSADLDLVTQGDKQSVTIMSQDAEAPVLGATIALTRG